MKTKIEIFFATDNNFVKHLSVAVASLLYNAAHDDSINISILTNGLTEKNLENLKSLGIIKKCNIEIIIVNDEFFSEFRSPSYINSSSTFYRYIIPVVKPNIDKALYLDCDVVVKESLYPLFETDLGDNYVGGVEDIHQCVYGVKLKPGFNLDTRYINAGVLLLNCKKFREDNITNRLFQLTSQLNPKVYFGADQDVINIAFEGRKKILDIKYNVISATFHTNLSTGYSIDRINNALKNPVIIHYTDSIKPWSSVDFPQNNFAYEYHKYLRLTPYKAEADRFLVNMIFKNRKLSKRIRKLKSNKAVELLGGLLKLVPDILSLSIRFITVGKQMRLYIKNTRL